MRVCTHRTSIAAAGVCIVSVLGYLLLAGSTEAPTTESLHPVLTIKGQSVPVEVVDTPELRQQGLSGRTELGEAYGMLFIFDQPGQYGIWMKDMHFSIDIIWINEEGEIIDIHHAIAPETYPEIFSPTEPARYVLETESGFSEQYDIKVGDRVDLPVGE